MREKIHQANMWTSHGSGGPEAKQKIKNGTPKNLDAGRKKFRK